MMDEILEQIALEYGVTRRQLTIGQIEDFFAEMLRKGREKEEEKEPSLFSPHTPLITYKNKEEEKRDPQNSAFLGKITQFTDEFNTLWKRYPRKMGKKDALRHYIAARRKNIPYQTISDGLDAYIDYIHRNGVQPGFVKWGSSWFCEYGWDDDYSGDYRTDRRKENLSDDEAERIAREVLYGSEDIN